MRLNIKVRFSHCGIVACAIADLTEDSSFELSNALLIVPLACLPVDSASVIALATDCSRGLSLDVMRTDAHSNIAL